MYRPAYDLRTTYGQSHPLDTENPCALAVFRVSSQVWKISHERAIAAPAGHGAEPLPRPPAPASGKAGEPVAPSGSAPVTKRAESVPQDASPLARRPGATPRARGAGPRVGAPRAITPLGQKSAPHAAARRAAGPTRPSAARSRAGPSARPASPRTRLRPLSSSSTSAPRSPRSLRAPRRCSHPPERTSPRPSSSFCS